MSRIREPELSPRSALCVTSQPVQPAEAEAAAEAETEAAAEAAAPLFQGEEQGGRINGGRVAACGSASSFFTSFSVVLRAAGLQSV